MDGVVLQLVDEGLVERLVLVEGAKLREDVVEARGREGTGIGTREVAGR